MEFQQKLEETRDLFFPARLPGEAGMTARNVDADTFRKEVTEIYAAVFTDRDAHPYNPNEELAAEYRTLHREHILIENSRGEVVGWVRGRMEDPDTFYLGTSGLLPEYRAQGLAATGMPRFFEYLHTLGYERVTSQHHPHNRAAMILQLKCGFSFEGINLDERWGPMVKMVFFFGDGRRAEFERRFGFEQYPKTPQPAGR
ncbi:GNAT family N-acetyltransferase [Streptomyces sp. NPDC005423]|uniref:GNAT family N-acetyltransferase n=1 Tax=Streptomyces sp. NPDC005423 TaxID=3155343 RepID=UPI0033A96C04